MVRCRAVQPKETVRSLHVQEIAMTDRERREVLALMAAGAAMASGVTAAQTADSRAAEVPAVFAVNRQPKPLRFDPAKLNGLSEKLIRSHWENNYVGSVRTLNLVTERLAAAKYIDAFMKNVNWEEVDKRFTAIAKM